MILFYIRIKFLLVYLIQYTNALTNISGRSQGDLPSDPLFITTRLLSDALSRLRIFVFGLDPMQWLLYRDRNVLYRSQICCLAILKSSVGVGMLIYYSNLYKIIKTKFIPSKIFILNIAMSITLQI